MCVQPGCDLCCFFLNKILHSLPRYKKDADGFLKVNMVRFETVEVTQEIMKNMAKKPQAVRKSQRTSSRVRKPSAAAAAAASAAAVTSPGSPAGSTSSSSSSASSYSSELSGGEDASSVASPRGSDSPVYCVMSCAPHMDEEEREEEEEEVVVVEEDEEGTSVAVEALTAVARGLGMDVV